MPSHTRPGVVALGAANVGADLFQGLAGDASLAQTASAEQTRSHMQLASPVPALLIVLTIVFLAGIFKKMPIAVPAYRWDY